MTIPLAKLAFPDKLRANRAPLLTEEYVVHMEVAGAGCAEGVEPCPCLKVDVPYTPIGCQALSCHVLSGKWRSTHVSAIALAAVEDAGVVVAGHVPPTAHDVVDVLAICRGV